MIAAPSRGGGVENSAQWFTNVEELIEYYVQYRLPVDGVGIVYGTGRNPISEDLSLVNPVVCWDQVSHLYLEDVNSDHDLSYFYGAIPLENAQTLLTYSGDFLLLYNDNEKLFVLALWGDRFVQIDMEPSPGDGLYSYFILRRHLTSDRFGELPVCCS
uniref:Uncharacterized protein n=1 Tax=Trichuris muris TaxID=70415 RepID=A0A5S6Q0N3_TRIMR